ncbi:MAG: DUF3617 family protein [Novosphingobium sp.]|nr:DUF3617 family protein [Novosphingobium sp.]
MVASNKTGPVAIVRFALNAGTGKPPATKPETPKTPPQESKPQDSSPEREAQTETATTAQEPQTAFETGRWVFITELYNVSKVDSSDTSFELSRQGIGARETDAQCVSQAIAKNPRASAFPFRAGMGCRPTNLSIAKNRYQGAMTCNFPQYGGRRPVDVYGQYSSNSLALDLRVRVPAQIVTGDFENPPEIYMHYRMTGYREGPC